MPRFMYASNADRITANVVVTETGCWQWQRRLNIHGYGQLTIDHKSWSSHRVSYEAFVGPIPDGLQLDHLCRNRACCNPEHLEPVTVKENAARSPITRGALSRLATACSQGHEFTEETTSFRKASWGIRRVCLICDRAQTRARRQRLVQQRLQSEGIAA